MISILFATAQNVTLDKQNVLDELNKALVQGMLPPVKIDAINDIYPVSGLPVYAIYVDYSIELGLSFCPQDDTVMMTQVARMLDGISIQGANTQGNLTVNWIKPSFASNAWHDRLHMAVVVFKDYSEAMDNENVEIPGTIITVEHEGFLNNSILENGYELINDTNIGIRIYMLPNPNSRVAFYASRDFIGFHEPDVQHRVRGLLRGLSCTTAIWDLNRWSLDPELGYFTTELTTREAKLGLYSTINYVKGAAA